MVSTPAITPMNMAKQAGIKEGLKKGEEIGLNKAKAWADKAKKDLPKPPTEPSCG